MEFLTADGTSKVDLTERKRGKGGTIVRLVQGANVPALRNHPALVRETYVVKDLFTRKNYFKPSVLGIGPEDLGIAFSVAMCDIEVVK